MKYATDNDVMESFPHPVLPTIKGEPDYHTINATIKFMQANSRAIDTHLGGGTLGHLVLIILDAYYATIAPTTAAGPTIWTSPQAPGRAPANTYGTATQISAARHIWEKDVQTYRTCTSVQQALKKQIISVFEPMYLDILNDNMVGYANISALEINFEHMRRAWDPQQPVESLFKQIQDLANYSKAGGVLIGHPQQISVVYANIFATGHFMIACCRWDEKHAIEKAWTQFKSHFAAARRQHKHIKGESATTAGYHSTNAAVSHNEDQISEATIVAFTTLATATAADRGVVGALTQANAHLAQQLEDNSNELRELKALIKKERTEKRGQRSFNPSPRN
jgi:hypothetical protein